MKKTGNKRLLLTKETLVLLQASYGGQEPTTNLSGSCDTCFACTSISTRQTTNTH